MAKTLVKFVSAKKHIATICSPIVPRSGEVVIIKNKNYKVLWTSYIIKDLDTTDETIYCIVMVNKI
jgi:hypothetical protein